METIEIKDINGVVLFVHTVKNNSIKITVEEAVKKNVILFGANLTNAELKGVNIEGANLDGAYLTGANLEGSNLERAGLNCVNFEGANLERASMKGAFLYRADLEGANLKDTNLRYTNFKGANLKDANLRVANLYYADLEGANLEGANLGGANLKRAYFIDTNLRGANFKGSNFEWASLDGAKNIPYIPLACPSEGAFIGWKKVGRKYLVKIQIPEDARRLSATTRKCRCDKAIVLDITSLDGETHFDEVVNHNYKVTTYKVGEIVYPDSFDENRWCECSNGIHFFVDKKDAIEY